MRTVQVVQRWDAPRSPSTTVDGAIVHSMGEYVMHGTNPIHAPDWLNRQVDLVPGGAKASVHAFIGPDGTVFLGVPLERIAWHAGPSLWDGRKGLSPSFLGAEFLVAGKHNWASFKTAIARPDAYTDAQYRAGGELYASWAKRFGIRRERILGHSQVSGADVRPDSKPDPGNFNWHQFWTYFDGAMRAAA